MAVKAGVIRAAARTTRRGAAETFTGVVFQDPVLTAEAPSRLGGSVVTFTPGARTAWHSHPVGQTLFCLSGVGRICFKGEKPQVLNPGDTVNIPPDTMHWHGASPDRLFSHLALSEAGEQGQGTAWGTHVSDAEYNEAASGGLMIPRASPGEYANNFSIPAASIRQSRHGWLWCRKPLHPKRWKSKGRNSTPCTALARHEMEEVRFH